MCGFSHGSHIMQGAGQCPAAETVHRQLGDADAGFAKRKARMDVVDAGYVSENICLTCIALGLNTVPRITII